MKASGNEIVCLVDNSSTHAILNEKSLFNSVTMCKSQVKTLFGLVELRNDFRTTTIILTSGIVFYLEDIYILYFQASLK